MKIIRVLLFPFSLLYAAITKLRNLFYDTGLLRSVAFDIPVIAVGNLSVGGTGKTPQIEYLIRLLQQDYNIAVLSRGYKRKSKGFVVADTQTNAELLGDEPFQYYQKFKNITVAVDADRVNGIKELLKLKKKVDVVLLDDAYQHRKVKAGFYILLTAYDDLFTEDYVLPTGNLREGRSGANRADAIIVTKCPFNLTVFEQNNIANNIKRHVNQDVFFSTISYEEEVKGKAANIRVDELSDYHVLLLTGIANPSPLLSFLKGEKVKFQHLKYPDHYSFPAKELEMIAKKFSDLPSEKKIILTTEKDFVRIQDKLDDLYYLPIQTTLLSQKESFDNSIINYVEQSLKNG